ncbi:MAG: DUF5663 domain-containing protein [Pseudomonadota bacterium]
MEDERNPYVVDFCKVLIEKKGLELSGEALSKMIEDMYRLFENMLGKNMVAGLPSDKRSEYLVQHEKEGVNFEKIGQMFEAHISRPDEIIKRTMKEFATVFMKNR